MKALQSTVEEKLSDLQIICEQTQSELDFYKFELKFFYNLIIKYFEPLSESEKLPGIQSAIIKLKELEKLEDKCYKHFAAFKQAYRALATRTDPESIDKLNELLQTLYCFKTDLFKSFRTFKTSFFIFFEDVVKTEETPKLLCK